MARKTLDDCYSSVGVMEAVRAPRKLTRTPQPNPLAITTFSDFNAVPDLAEVWTDGLYFAL